MLKPHDLTPVEQRGNIYLKRDDLFTLFEEGGINGTKTRQCYYLVMANFMAYTGLLTGCSIHSPQAPIVAGIANHLRIPCTVFYGGTSTKSIEAMDMPKLVMHYGAFIDLSCKTGRSNVLQSKLYERANNTNEFVVKYGIDIISDFVLDLAVGKQVENIPEQIENLVVTCGSGITTIGILKGLEKFKKDHIKNIILVGTAPNRLKKLEDKLGGNLLHKRNRFLDKIIYIDLYNTPGFLYERPEYQSLDGLEFHPNYEAKTFKWLKDSQFYNEKTLFWIVGAYPKIKELN